MNQDVTDSIAKIIATVGIDGARKVAQTPYSIDDRRMAMKVGFCDALADNGLTPSDFDAVMLSNPKVAKLEFLGALPGVGAKLTIGMILGAALAGNFTGKAHHSIERRLNKMDDAENVKLREKANRIAAQRDELAEDLASRPISSVSPSPAAKKQKQDMVSLLD